MAAIWCPGLDAEMQKCINSILSQPLWGVTRYYEGYMKELHFVDKAEKLYIICHGHALLPLFTTTVRSWTAAEMAELIERDQLSKEHQVIELLVCHAGESITSVSNSKERFKIRDQALALKKAGKTAEFEAMQNKFKAIEKDYRAFEARASAKSDEQLLPMSAQLINELKNRGYKNMRIISYGAAIAQYFYEGTVKLDLAGRNGGRWGEDASKHPGLKSTWL